MAEQKESSVLFSLKELMNLEEDRIRQEEAERRRQAEAIEQSRVDAERRTREAEEGRIRAEDDKRRQEEARAREEAARLDAIRHAEVEKARLEAEHAARMAAVRDQQEHERKIAVIAQDKSKKNLKFAAMGIAAALLVALVGGGMAIKSQSDEAEIQRVKSEQALAEQKAQSDALSKKIEDQTKQMMEAQQAIAAATDDSARNAAKAKLLEADRARENAKKQLNNIRQSGTPGVPKSGVGTGTKCTPGDPLCSDIAN